ncbi:MAG: stage III sporulation protein AD [Clostridia bacterium]|nr:stage III sporulation protein AD [Clostridia bacterium]
MEILQIVGLALLGTVLLTIVRQTRSDIAVALSAAVGVVVFMMAASRLAQFVSVLTQLADAAGVSRIYLDTVLRVVGVAYLAAFGAQVCRDAGEGALASKVELAGKVLILMMSVPLMFALLELVFRVLPS